MCKLLHIISPRIVSSIWELVEFYAYAVHEIVAKDAVSVLSSLFVFIKNIHNVIDNVSGG